MTARVWSASRWGIALLTIPSGVATAQSRNGIVDRVQSAANPSVVTTTFTVALPHDSGTVRRIQQVVVPMSLQLDATSRIRVDVGAAVVSSNVSGQDSLKRERTLSLSGISDIRARAVMQIVRDRLLLSALVNLPTGLSKLNLDQEQALRVVAAPVLKPPTGVAGLGLGANVGLVYAFSVGAWNWAVGSSYEHRGKYSPIDATLFGLPIVTTFTPGDGIRGSIGVDRFVGEGRFAFVSALEVFQRDSIELHRHDEGATGTPIGSSSVRLGRQISLGAEWAPGWRKLRETRMFVAHHLRLPFTNAQGEKQAGSFGQTLDAGMETVIGRANGFAVTWRGVGHLDSGLDFDKTLLTAACSDVTGTVGARFFARGFSLEPQFGVRVGSIDLGGAKSAFRSTTIGLLVRH